MKLLLSLAALLLAAAPLPAQEEEGTATPSAPAAAAPAVVAPTLDPNEMVGPLILPPNSPNNLDVILMNYEQLSGKILLKDSSISSAATPLSLVINRQLPRVEMLRLIESFLLLNGYAIVPSGDNAVKVLNTQSGKNPRQEGTRLYTNIDDIPKGDEVISFFLPFKYLSSDDASTVIQSYWAPHATLGGALVPIKSAQAVILVESASVIREIVKLQELIDVPPSRMKSGFIELKRADAETVVELVTKLLDARKQQQSSSGQSGNVRPGGVRQPNGAIQRPNQPANPNQPPQGGGDQGDAAISYNDVQLVADTRTNRVLIEAMPASYDYIRKLVEEFDAAIILNEPVIIPLNFVKANDILPVLQTLLTENKKDAGANATGNQNTGNTNRQSTNRSTGGGSSSSSGGDSESPDALDAPAEETPPEAVVIGNIRLIADQKTNSIVVIGATEAVEKIRNVIATLDKRPQQVYLATVIGELRLTDDFKWSIDYVQKIVKSGSFGNGSSLNTTSETAKSMSPSAAALNTLGFAAVPGLGYYLTVSNTLQAMVQLLEGTKMFRVLSRPSVYTANNKKAVIRSGREVAVPSSTVSNLNAGTNDNAAVTSNIDFKTIELKLEVVPLINANRQVTLEIAQKNDSQIGTTNITGIEVPEIQTQRVNTTVTVNDQSTVVLGGLITDETRISEQGIPWVSQIPLIGYLFKNENRTKERRELVVMIQPTVIAESDDASKESNEEAGKYDVAPGARHILEEGTTENKLRGEKILKDREKKLNLEKSKSGGDGDGKPVPKAAPISEADAAKVTMPPVKGS